MKVWLGTWLFLGAMSLLCGCAALPALPSMLSTPKPSEGFLTATEVKQSEANFRVVKANAVGTAKGFKILGIIGIKPTSYAKAITHLYTNAPMSEGRAQTWANVVYEKTSSYYVLFSIPRVTVRADLIEFTGASAPTRPAP